MQKYCANRFVAGIPAAKPSPGVDEAFLKEAVKCGIHLYLGGIAPYFGNYLVVPEKIFKSLFLPMEAE